MSERWAEALETPKPPPNVGIEPVSEAPPDVVVTPHSSRHTRLRYTRRRLIRSPQMFLTIVIPTFNRPDLLPEAVRSALYEADADTEVLVVPNGDDTSWRMSLRPFSNDNRVRIAPIARANANAARNHGLLLARGKYIRFLDDDDFLYSCAAFEQCKDMDRTDADVSSGAIDLIDRYGNIFETWPQPATNDFISSVLLPNRVAHLAAHIFRRSALGGARWDEAIQLGQDTSWIHQLCREREWLWRRLDTKVGVWRHHSGVRISTSKRSAIHCKVSLQYLLETVNALDQQGRLYPLRRDAAAKGMWALVHAGFFSDVSYWAHILHMTQQRFPKTYPSLPIYKHRIGRVIPPILLELAMTPKRLLNRAIRSHRYKPGSTNYVIRP